MYPTQPPARGPTGTIMGHAASRSPYLTESLHQLQAMGNQAMVGAQSAGKGGSPGDMLADALQNYGQARAAKQQAAQQQQQQNIQGAQTALGTQGAPFANTLPGLPNLGALGRGVF